MRSAGSHRHAQRSGRRLGAAASVAALVHLAGVPLLPRLVREPAADAARGGSTEPLLIEPIATTEITLPKELPSVVADQVVQATHPSERPPTVETHYISDQDSNPGHQSRLRDPIFGPPAAIALSPSAGGQATVASTASTLPPASSVIRAPVATRPAGNVTNEGELAAASSEDVPTIAALLSPARPAPTPARIEAAAAPPEAKVAVSRDKGATARVAVPASASGQTEDELEDLLVGDQSAVVARRTAMGVMMQAVRARVRSHWRVREVFPRLGAAWRLSEQSLVTTVNVRLAADGRVEAAHVERSSGQEQMDLEAVAAFARADPFTAPPGGVLDDKGGVTFSLDMEVELAEHQFRMRTRQLLGELWRPSPAFQRNGDHERVTTARVLITADGVLARASVVGAAGIDFLDKGALHALRAGLRLPRPPASYREVEGLTTLWIEFHHNVRRTSIIKVLSPSERPQLLRAAND